MKLRKKIKKQEALFKSAQRFAQTKGFNMPQPPAAYPAKCGKRPKRFASKQEAIHAARHCSGLTSLAAHDFIMTLLHNEILDVGGARDA